jgi:hypothetical protein
MFGGFDPNEPASSGFFNKLERNSGRGGAGGGG